MEEYYIKEILERLAKGNMNVGEAFEKLKTLPFTDLEFACIDEHRNLRTGRGEVIFGQGRPRSKLRP